MSGPAGIRLQSVVSGRKEIFLFGPPLILSLLSMQIKQSLSFIDLFQHSDVIVSMKWLNCPLIVMHTTE